MICLQIGQERVERDGQGLRESEPGRESGEEEASAVTELLLQLWSCLVLALKEEVLEHRRTHALGTL